MSRQLKNLVRLQMFAAALCIPGVAWAHPGHGPASGFAAGFGHPFTGLDHLFAMIAVGVFAASLGGRALWAVPATFVAVMAAGAAIGVSGAALPFPELVIALSVVALGAAIVSRRRWSVAGAMALVGLFAVYHGYAHGAEMPGNLSGAEYGLGFVLATVALHLTGIGIGLASGRLDAHAGQVLNVGGAAIAVAGGGLLLGLV